MATLQGILDLNLSFNTSKLTLTHSIPLENIIKAISEAGYGAKVVGKEESTTPSSFWQRNFRAILTILSSAFLAVGLALDFLKFGDQVIIPLYLLAMIIGGYHVARAAFYSVRAFTFDMNFLMIIAAIGATILGEWSEGATVVVLFALGNTLQAYTMDKTRKSIQSLMELSPKEALVKRKGQEVTLPVDEIVIGDIVIVKPGQKIPMDGIVQSGLSYVNQAPITGESLPVEKCKGSEVFAGTINEKGSLDIRVTKLVEDTTLTKIIHLVEEAQSQKAPSEQFVDKFSKYYTPAVISIAVLIAIIPPLIMGQSLSDWVYKALVLLVIACPCALVISTPVSIVSAIGNAAKHGVLIKGGAYLEEAGAIKAIAFDKTGTLTKGTPEVSKVKVLDNSLSDSELTAIAASVEARSQHPIASAIINYANKIGVKVLNCEGFQALDGKGVKAIVKGREYIIGNLRLFEELDLNTSQIQDEIVHLQSQGQTVMVVGSSDQILGLISVSDQVRKEGPLAISKLREVGIKKVVMLTGDNRGAAQAIADKLGVDEVKAELLPNEKLDMIRQLLAENGKVAMVGDGVNDAPALATSTVGISMGVAGTDTALETADIALMADDLSKLPFTIKLSRKALGIIKQNIAFSLLVKGIFIALTFVGITNLWLAVFADTGAAIIVIINGMRLLTTRP